MPADTDDDDGSFLFVFLETTWFGRGGDRIFLFDCCVSVLNCSPLDTQLR